MEATNKAPNVPIDKFKRTKIVATLGPSSHNYETVLKLIKAGVNGIRLNFSHGNEAERLEQIKWVRQAAHEYGKPVAIIQDLQGPKIRLGDFDGIINVKRGHDLKFKYEADFARSGIIPLQFDLSKKLKRGERLYLYDGKVHAVVMSVANGVVHARAENEGILIRRKGINVPDTDFGGDIITAKDKKDLAFGSSNDIDFVALSFVQTAADVTKLRTMLKNLGSSARIIAKIETKAALDNLESILRASDAVMVARGDLAVETTPEAVPLAQKRIIDLGQSLAKPTIVATQMLASMTEASEPTRAEVSDVATAVLSGADAVMLSDETASGRYPVESVEVMKRVINYTEKHRSQSQVTGWAGSGIYGKAQANEPSSRQSAISSAIINLADTIDATAIVAETKSGATALQIAARRPDIPLIAVTSTARVAQQLAIVYGIKSYARPDDKFAATKLTNWLHKSRVLSKGDIVVTASGQYPGVVGTTDTIKVRLL